MMEDKLLTGYECEVIVEALRLSMIEIEGSRVVMGPGPGVESFSDAYSSCCGALAVFGVEA